MSQHQLPDRYKEAARRAISLNMPFALFAAPGEEYRFFASEPDDAASNLISDRFPEKEAFFAQSFCTSMHDAVAIPCDMTADDVLELPSSTEAWPSAELNAVPVSTPYPAYYGQIREIRKRMSPKGLRKAVLSRRISCCTAMDPVELADRYFASLPSTFRALYFTQETGLWITATPELLIKASASPEEDAVTHFETMSLAGTRSKGSSDDWDAKNRAEHQAVLDFICDALRESGLEPQVGERHEVAFGDVEHICHRISADGHANVFELLDNLSPTPALAGLPRDLAIKTISQLEIHHRQCYGGLVGTISGSSIDAYVNIRSALLSPHHGPDDSMEVNIFAGGGIMPDSVASVEWREAARKAMPLYSIISSIPDYITQIPGNWERIDNPDAPEGLPF